VTERPEDEQRDEEQEGTGQEPAAESEPSVEEPAPEPAPEEPAPEPVAEEPAPEPMAEEPAPEPVAQEPTAEEPSEPTAQEQPEPPAGPEPEIAADAEPAPVGEEEEVVIEAQQSPLEDEELIEDEEVEVIPREKPEIPGADLIPDIVPEGEQFLDAEAQAAAEAEAEAMAAAREREEAEEEARPIADAAIDLAAGARYTATGKRKTAVARVIIKPGSGTYVINGKTLEAFFPRETLQRIIRQPLETVGYESRMDVVARMHGGGVAAQAGALRHGISRALLEADPNLRGELKRRGFLTRDPRVKERKKAGLKKARKRPQFSKR